MCVVGQGIASSWKLRELAADCGQAGQTEAEGLASRRDVPHRRRSWERARAAGGNDPGSGPPAVFSTTAAPLRTSGRRGSWSPPIQRLLRRLDHSNIFLIIAGTYTPFAVFTPPVREPRCCGSSGWERWPGCASGLLDLRPSMVPWSTWLSVGWLCSISRFLGRSRNCSGGVDRGRGSAHLGALVYGLNVRIRLLGGSASPGVPRLTVAAFVVHYVAVSLVVYA